MGPLCHKEGRVHQCTGSDGLKRMQAASPLWRRQLRLLHAHLLLAHAHLLLAHAHLLLLPALHQQLRLRSLLLLYLSSAADSSGTFMSPTQSLSRTAAVSHSSSSSPSADLSCYNLVASAFFDPPLAVLPLRLTVTDLSHDGSSTITGTTGSLCLRAAGAGCCHGEAQVLAELLADEVLF